MRMRYLGWSAFELRKEDRSSVLIDPYLSGNPKMEIPKSPVRIDDLKNVSLVLVSHGATDHLGDAFEIMRQNPGAVLCGGSDVRTLASRLGVKDECFALAVPGTEVLLDEIGLNVKALRAVHYSRVTVEGALLSSACALSYVLTFDEGLTIFHGGDTAITLDFLMYNLLYHPQVAMLGVGGATINGRKIGEMNPKEALFAAMMLGVRTVIPMHYTATEGGDFKRLVETCSMGHMVCCVPQPGEWFELR
jgi:L-ascorbate metabolism protein UlaG (beta-lactamase superfamily)